MSDEKIRAAIKVECDRQHVGEDRQEMLYKAYNTVRSHSVLMDRLYEDILQTIAVSIEPSNKGQYRTTPVTFNGVVGGVSPEHIPGNMMAWIQWFNAELALWTEIELSNADSIIKEFLDIHPFIDGNGRTAWLLRVWMLDQWNDPQPLPDYYGE